MATGRREAIAQLPDRDPPHRYPLLANLRETVPLFALAGAGIVLGVILFEDTGGGHTARLPLWMLSVAIGVVALGGGMAGLFAGDFRPPERHRTPIPPGGYVIVPVEEWERERGEESQSEASSRPWSEDREDEVGVAPTPVPPEIPAPVHLTAVPSADSPAGTDPAGVRPPAAPPPTAVAVPRAEPVTRTPTRPTPEVVPVPPTRPRDDLGALLEELEREAIARREPPTPVPRDVVPVPAPAPAPRMVVCATCLGKIDPAGEQTRCRSCGLVLCPRCYHLGEKISPGANLCRFCRSR